MDILLKQENLTGFPGGEAVTTTFKEISFPLEREEAVDEPWGLRQESKPQKQLDSAQWHHTWPSWPEDR
jgi:hypothetical protein